MAQRRVIARNLAMEDTPIVERPLAEPPSPPPSLPPAPPKFDLWMLAALGCLPLTVLFLSIPQPTTFVVAWIFFVAIAFHCFIRYRRRRSLSVAAFTGAWLLPVVGLIAIAIEYPRVPPDMCSLVFALCLVGLVSGFVIAKQIGAAIVFVYYLRRRARGETRVRTRGQSVRERLDAASTPFAAPPSVGLPRRFGIRGMFIVTTWAAVLMGGLRACGAPPATFFRVISFAACVMAGQVLLFNGRRPFRASMFVGAIVLPAEMLVPMLMFSGRTYPSRMPVYFFLALYAASLAYYVCIGIVLGVVAGAVGGWLYYISEEFLVWITRGVPSIALEPITDADADVLIAWIGGPKLCLRWAGRRLSWPLDREQLLRRFALAQGERPIRRIFKAVDLRSGNMFGYVELGGIDYQARNAWLEMPLIDPDSSERGRIGVLLLRAAAREAFEKLDLVSLKVFLDNDQSEVAVCCEKAWVNEYSYRRRRKDGVKGRITVFRRLTSLSDPRSDESESSAG
jgi:hypothetical protein